MFCAELTPVILRGANPRHSAWSLCHSAWSLCHSARRHHPYVILRGAITPTSFCAERSAVAESKPLTRARTGFVDSATTRGMTPPPMFCAPTLVILRAHYVILRGAYVILRGAKRSRRI